MLVIYSSINILVITGEERAVMIYIFLMLPRKHIFFLCLQRKHKLWVHIRSTSSFMEEKGWVILGGKSALSRPMLYGASDMCLHLSWSCLVSRTAIKNHFIHYPNLALLHMFWIFHVAEVLALLALGHEVLGSNPIRGGSQLRTVQHLFAYHFIIFPTSSQYGVTHCWLNELPLKSLWKSLILILGMSDYMM